LEWSVPSSNLLQNFATSSVKIQHLFYQCQVAATLKQLIIYVNFRAGASCYYCPCCEDSLPLNVHLKIAVAVKIVESLLGAIAVQSIRII
jgi:hypothetical protein